MIMTTEIVKKMESRGFTEMDLIEIQNAFRAGFDDGWIADGYDGGKAAIWSDRQGGVDAYDAGFMFGQNMEGSE